MDPLIMYLVFVVMCLYSFRVGQKFEKLKEAELNKVLAIAAFKARERLEKTRKQNNDTQP